MYLQMSATEIKRGLLRELGRQLLAYGSSHETIARRLKIPRPEISAILGQKASRFTLERILKLLSQCGCDINVSLAALGKGGLVCWETLKDLGLEWLPLSDGPGLTLIGGDDADLRRKVLAALLRAHAARGDRTVLYCQEPSSQDLPTVRFEADRDIQKLITYHSDIDLPQRARFGASIVGIDSVSKSAASPWTAMHFAKEMRVYVVIDTPIGPKETQRVADTFLDLLGPPHVVGHWKHVHEVLDAIIVPRVADPVEGGAPTYLCSLAKVRKDSELVEVVRNGEAEQEDLAVRGLSRPVNRESPTHLATFADAAAFMERLASLFDSEFSVVESLERSPKEIEIDVRDRHSSASVSIAVSWTSRRRCYGIVFVSEEPDELASPVTPTTLLAVAPADAEYLVRRTQSFLRRFSAL